MSNKDRAFCVPCPQSEPKALYVSRFASFCALQPGGLLECVIGTAITFERTATHRTRNILVSVLDLDSLMSRDRAQMNEPAHRPSPTRENRHDTDVYLSERCKTVSRPRVQQDDRTHARMGSMIMLVYLHMRHLDNAHGGATDQFASELAHYKFQASPLELSEAKEEWWSLGGSNS